MPWVQFKKTRLVILSQRPQVATKPTRPYSYAAQVSSRLQTGFYSFWVFYISKPNFLIIWRELFEAVIRFTFTHKVEVVRTFANKKEVIQPRNGPRSSCTSSGCYYPEMEYHTTVSHPCIPRQSHNQMGSD